MAETMTQESSSGKARGPQGHAGAAGSGGASVRSTWPLYVMLGLIAGLVAAVLGWSFAGESLAALGIPDPGPLTLAGLPFLRALGWFLVSLAVGSFLASSFLLAPRTDDLQSATLSADGSVAQRTGSFALFGFGLIGLMMVPLVLSDVAGEPLAGVLSVDGIATALSQVADARVWLMVAGISFVVGTLSLFTSRWMWQPVWLVGAVLTTAPLGLSGHSAAGGDHDYGTNSLLWHILFALLWVGGLLGLIAHARRLGPDMGVAVARYSKIAFIAAIVMAVTGVINASIRVRFEDLFTVAYGGTVVAKFVLTIVLALFGWYHRKKTIPLINAAGGSTRLFARVAIVETVFMAAIMGVATSMSRTPPPPPRDIKLSPMILEMGYEVTKEPTLTSVWTVWRFDLMFGTLGIILSLLYIWGVLRLRRSGVEWKWQRTAWFLLGSISLAVCMSSGVGLYMTAMFSMHMVAHMVLSMVIPVFLVLGNPIELALKAIKPGAPGRPGMHEWIQAFLKSRTLAFVMQPWFNTIQFVVIFYLLYITPWYDLMVSEHAGHLIMNWVFLGSGYLYYWEMIGGDPKPAYNSVVKRLAWLVFSMPFHLYFGVYLMQLSQILAEDFYRGLELPFEVDLMADQDVGGGIAWASGSFPLVIVFGTLFMLWLREDREETKAFDEKAELARKHHEQAVAAGEATADDIDEDDELAAYNAMLAQLSGGATHSRPSQAQSVNRAKREAQKLSKDTVSEDERQKRADT